MGDTFLLAILWGCPKALQNTLLLSDGNCFSICKYIDTSIHLSQRFNFKGNRKNVTSSKKRYYGFSK